MAESYADLLKIVSELKPRYFFAIWFPGAILVFAPVALLERLGFTAFVEQYRGWIGVITFICFMLWLVQLYSHLSEKRKDKIAKKQIEIEQQEKARLSTEKELKKQEEILEHFDSLSDGEKFLLQCALARNQQTIITHLSDPHAVSLCHKRIIVSAPKGDMLNFPFQIPSFVWEFMKENEDMILPQNQKDKDDLLIACREYQDSFPSIRNRILR